MAKKEKRGGCLSKLIKACIALLVFILLLGHSTNETEPTPSAAPTKTQTSTPWSDAFKNAATAAPTATPTVTTTAKPTEMPSTTPAIPGTYRPGIEGTNAYDIIGALKTLGIDTPRRQTVNDGYYWWSGNLTEGNVDYNIEIETDKSYRVTTMQIMMHGGNNNFVWWACACMFGENSEQVAWLKENMWNDTTTTKVFVDDMWTIVPMEKGVYLTVQHVDAEAWYLSLI